MIIQDPFGFCRECPFPKRLAAWSCLLFGGGVVLSDACRGSEYSARNNHESSNDFENCCVAENVWPHALQLIEEDFGGPIWVS